MKWWWLGGVILIGGLLTINENWYGDAAAIGTPAGMIVATLIGMKNLKQKQRLKFGLFFALLIGMIVIYAIPTYSVIEAEQLLQHKYEQVRYIDDVGVINEGWNPFQPKRVYLFEIESGKRILFLPDSGEIVNVIKTRPH